MLEVMSKYIKIYNGVEHRVKMMYQHICILDHWNSTEYPLDIEYPLGTEYSHGAEYPLRCVYQFLNMIEIWMGWNLESNVDIIEGWASMHLACHIYFKFVFW
jgi:hypothetical protein